MRLPLTSLALALALAACSSTPTDENGNELPDIGAPVKADKFLDVPTTIEHADTMTIGAFLGEVGYRIQAWSSAKFAGDGERARILRQVLEFECTKRQAELIAQLESGPARNRSVAAVALGFTNRMDVLRADFSTTPVDKGAEALSPLLNAISDPDPEVSANALMGLGILARPETPLGPICNALDGSAEPIRRGNAAFALSGILEAAAKREEGIEIERADLVRTVCMRALSDSDLSVRTQAAAVLGLVGNGDTIAYLGDRLDDEVALVGQAAGTALVRMTRRDPTYKGRVARLLVGRLDMVRPTRRDTVVYSLVLLAGRHLGNDTEVWRDWAKNLPAS
ncbi:MAG: hypothetical protein P1V81_06525 [Planctomycetota bacterium]|nr:hypothetical protein [Planctomycetota bacterium]